jgi:hypothetical protein
MNFNPYQAPTSAYDGSYSNYGSSGVVSDRTIAALRKTRPWVVFIAVVSFVFTGFSALASLGAMTTSVATGIGSLIVTAIYLLPGIALFRYGSAINKLLHGGGVAELEQAMDAQASVWQIAGIFVLISLVLGVILLIAVVALGAAFANSF